jgi:hypothetical protein
MFHETDSFRSTGCGLMAGKRHGMKWVVRISATAQAFEVLGPVVAGRPSAFPLCSRATHPQRGVHDNLNVHHVHRSVMVQIVRRIRYVPEQPIPSAAFMTI